MNERTPLHHHDAARVVLAHRGDALVPHLLAALSDRYPGVQEADAELSRVERLAVAATTWRPARRVWAEHFFKSNLAVALRSRRAERNLSSVGRTFDAVVQVHALFELEQPHATIYVDCTHQQSADHWPDWNPLQGKALDRWVGRERRQYHAASHLFAFSDQTRDSLVRDYDVPAERVSVVGAGVNFTALPDTVERDGEADREGTAILFVGNDFERKGGPELLEAFRLVRERVPSARLQIVGTPHGISPQDGVEVVGRVSGRDAMSELYRNAAVFCLPSFFDPFPLVVLEAMAHGLPVVATPTCGVPEMVVDGGTGLLVEHGPGAVTRLADALLQVIEQPALAGRLGAAGRRRVEQRFLWEHVVDRMSPVLDELTPCQHPAPRAGQSEPEGQPNRHETFGAAPRPSEKNSTTNHRPFAAEGAAR